MQSSGKKVALVTGANKGIGFEIAWQIGRTGVTVLLGARNKAAGEEAAATLGAEGIDARFIAIDVADYASIKEAAAAITSGFGHLEILVNNAGINDPGDGPAPIAGLTRSNGFCARTSLVLWQSRRLCFRCCINRRLRVS